MSTKELLLKIKKLEERNKELEQNLSFLKSKENASVDILLNSIPGFAFVKDINLNYVGANRTFCDRLKIPYDEIKGKTDYDIFPKDLAEKYIKDDKKVLKTGEAIFVEEITVDAINPDSGFIAATRKLPWFDDEGNIVGLYGLRFDISGLNYIEKLKKAKEKAEESQLTFRKLFEDSSDAILLIDTSGVFVECNRAALDLLKMTREEFMFQPPASISPEFQPNGRKSEDAALEMIELAYSKGLQRFDWTCVNSEGDEFIVEVSLMPISVKGQTMLHTTWRDITIRKSIELELVKAKETAEENERRFRSLFNYSMDAIYIHDYDGKIIDVNNTACRQSGYSREEWMKMTIFDGLSNKPDTINPTKNAILEIWSKWGSGQTALVEAEHKHKNGTIYPVEIASSIVQVGNQRLLMAIVRDITERKKYETELLIAKEKAEESEILKNKLVANIGDVIVIIDHEGNNRYKSPNVEKLFGWKPEELTGNNAFDNIHSDDIEKARNFIDYLLSEPNKKGDIEIRYRHKNGDYSWIKFTGSNLLHDPIINGILGNYHEISGRKNAEIELIKAQEKANKYTEMILSSQSVANICSYSTNLIVEHLDKSAWECSPEFYKIFGIDETYPHTIAGWANFIHPDFREELVAYHEYVVKTGSSFNKEYKIIRINDGAERWVHGTGELVYDNRGKPVRMYGAIQDITEIKKTEDDLIKAKEKAEENEEKLIEAQELSHVGSWEYYIDKDMVFWSKELYNIFERSNNLPAPKYSEQQSFYSTESFLKLDKAVQDCIQKGIPYEIELDIITSSGAIKQIISKGHAKTDEQGKIIGSYGTAQDITVQKKLERELIKAKEKAEESELKLKLIADNFVNGMLYQVALIDETNRKFNYVSEAVNKLYNCTVKEAMQNPDLIYGKLHPDDIGELIEKEKEALKNMSVFEAESRVIKPDGSIRWAYYISKPRIIDGLACWDGVEIDITERKQMELDLLKAKQKAEEANRLKTEFLNNMSHEIRTPMNGIIGFSELLDNPDISKEKRKYYSKIVQNSSQQLLRIIDDIMEISTLETKQERLNETEFCLNDLLMELFSIFNLKSKERNIPLYLKKELNDNRSVIITDKAKLNKIISNLIENALKFTSEGYVEFGYRVSGENLILYVKDTGIGIAPNNHALIFERFSQAEKDISLKHGGLGLGLSICKENTQLLGGDITLESEKRKGSTFYVTIPYKPAKITNDNESKNNNGIEKTAEEKYTILIAEDEEVNSLYLEALFQQDPKQSYNVIHAKNGKEAVEICEANSIDLILMDIKMPVMNGYEATEKIKEKFPNLPIIAQTAYSTAPDIQLALKHGCDDFISKPIDREKLLKLTTKHLNNK